MHIIYIQRNFRNFYIHVSEYQEIFVFVFTFINLFCIHLQVKNSELQKLRKIKGKCKHVFYIKGKSLCY